MLRQALLLIGVFFFCFFVPQNVQAAVDLAGSEVATGAATVALPITDLQLTGSSEDPVPVKLRVTSGTLQMSTITGLTFDGSQTGSTIYFSGSVANVNAALATLTYTRNTTGTDTLEVSLVPQGEVFFTENNHLYEFISGTITATAAKTAAEGRTKYGATGYLVTVTSEEENEFVSERLVGDGWMGAADSAVEGDWKWISGPETGTSFWSGTSGGSAVSGRYNNWNSGEPNNSGNEDCAQFYASTGRWNDLPCSYNLGGYVVEYGAPGDLPAVAAKDISITTVSKPVINTFSPTDGATGVTLNSNLVLEFNKLIQVGTGNIVIKSSSDDSTVETIDVTSELVTGSNSTTLTINPSSTLQESTGYYVTFPNTVFKDVYNNVVDSISSSTAWNFVTGDFTAPTLSSIAASSAASTSATISWTTNENASTKVVYGLTNAYGTSPAETDTSPRVTAHSFGLSNLLPCTLYHYKVTSTDASSNSASSTDNSFVTLGCAREEIPTKSNSSSITVAAGGSTSLTEDSWQLMVTTPSNFTNESSTVVIQIKSVASSQILSSYGKPSTAPNQVGSKVFDVKAIIDGDTVLENFDQEITITYQYTDADVAGLNEAALWLYHYHDNAWEALDNCTVNTTTNTITCTTDGFSLFGLFSTAAETSSNSNSSSTSTSGTKCSQLSPGVKPPWLYGGISTEGNTIELHFAPGDNPFDHFILEYGVEPGKYTMGAQNIGGKDARTFLVQSLNANTTYYFRIRGANGCAVGPWSDELAATTKNNVVLNNLQFTQTKISAVPKEKKASPSSELSTQQATEQSVLGYQVEVKVLDEENNPVGGAQVTLHSTPRHAVTNEQGIATFTDVEPGQHKVIIAYNDFEGEQSLHLTGEVEKFEIEVTVKPTKVVFSKMVYSVIGLLVAIIIGLVIALLTKEKKAKTY